MQKNWEKIAWLTITLCISNEICNIFINVCSLIEFNSIDDDRYIFRGYIFLTASFKMADSLGICNIY